VGIELFAAAGGGPINNAAMTALTVGPGATVTIGTAGTIFADATLSAGSFPKGSARILSTSKSLICSAFIAEAQNVTPTSGCELTIVAKTRQKAFN